MGKKPLMQQGFLKVQKVSRCALFGLLRMQRGCCVLCARDNILALSQATVKIPMVFLKLGCQQKSLEKNLLETYFQTAKIPEYFNTLKFSC